MDTLFLAILLFNTVKCTVYLELGLGGLQYQSNRMDKLNSAGAPMLKTIMFLRAKCSEDSEDSFKGTVS